MVRGLHGIGLRRTRAWDLTLCGLVLAGSALVASPASADEGSAEVVARPEPEEPGAALYRQAEARYVAGDVAGALVLMQQSYEASQRPELLFNLGQLHRDLGQCVEARKSYARYLDLAKSGTRRHEAESIERELASECPEGAASSPPPLATAPSKPYFTPIRIAAWSTLGCAVGLAIGATYFAGRASGREDQLEERIRAADSSGGSFTAADKQLEIEGLHAATLARGLGVGAIGLAAIGASLLVFNPENRETSTNGLSVRWSRDGATAEYRGAF
jgi:hypothetical protein